jgi:hypothetical protein
LFRDRRFAKPVITLVAAAAVVVAVGGCGFLKLGSLAVSQPQGIGSARVHFNLCTIGNPTSEGEACAPNTETVKVQYLAGIAVPPGSVPPASFTAVPVNGGTAIVFTRNDEVTSEMTASSAATQAALAKAESPEEIEEAEEFEALLGGSWPPSGLQGVGYISTPSLEVEDQTTEWSVDADFGLPTPAAGGLFTGPFPAAIALGFRQVSSEEPASRSVHCLRFAGETLEPDPSEAFCTGSLQQSQAGTADLRIAAPAQPAQAFVGGSAEVAFPLEYAGTTAAPPTFALSATTTATGGRVTVPSSSFTPSTPDPSTHLAPAATGTVNVALPRGVKPGTYQVTVTAKAPQGGAVTQVASVKVTRPTLKLGKVKPNPAKGTAALQVSVPGGGKLTIAGKGVAKVTKKISKAKTLKVKIAATGKAGAALQKIGKAKLKLKATFKPTSGISVSKTKSVVLKLR